MFCLRQISVTIKDRDTGIFVVWAKTFSLCNVRVKFAKCQFLVDFEQFLQFWFQKLLYFLYYRSWTFFFKFSGVSAAAPVSTTLNKQHCSTFSIRHIPQCDYPILPKCTYSSLVSKQQIAFDYFYSMCRWFARMSFSSYIAITGLCI